MKKILRKYIPESFINYYHKCQAILANIIYGYPGKKLVVIGVTGTNGKTTTSYFISKILDESGNKNALASTVYFKIGKKTWENKTKMTTLNPFTLQKFLKDAVDNNCRFAVIETSSHAIVQERIWGIKYDALVFTNITHEHFDYHKNFKSYLEAKKKLFIDNKDAFAILNIDDPNFSHFKNASGGSLITYSVKGAGVVNAKKIRLYDDMSQFLISWLGNDIEAKIKIPGIFNISNALASFCVGLYYKISPKTIVNALEKIDSLPGRMEFLNFGQNYKIIVDFAHTPDGLQKVFEAIKPVVLGRLIHVGGATGERDKTKRPIMGAISGKYADISIVTDEDPGFEDPDKIIDEVALGVVKGAPKNSPKKLGENFFKITNREKAIRFALKKASKNDIVLITGKGHEKVMKIKDKLVSYSDQSVVKRFFNERS